MLSLKKKKLLWQFSTLFLSLSLTAKVCVNKRLWHFSIWICIYLQHPPGGCLPAHHHPHRPVRCPTHHHHASLSRGQRRDVGHCISSHYSFRDQPRTNSRNHHYDYWVFTYYHHNWYLFLPHLPRRFQGTRRKHRRPDFRTSSWRKQKDLTHVRHRVRDNCHFRHLGTHRSWYT